MLWRMHPTAERPDGESGATYTWGDPFEFGDALLDLSAPGTYSVPASEESFGFLYANLSGDGDVRPRGKLRPVPRLDQGDFRRSYATFIHQFEVHPVQVVPSPVEHKSHDLLAGFQADVPDNNRFPIIPPAGIGNFDTAVLFSAGFLLPALTPAAAVRGDGV